MNKQTQSALLRKIERLEAQVKALQEQLKKVQGVSNEFLYEKVDAEMRIDQAMRILSGAEK